MPITDPIQPPPGIVSTGVDAAQFTPGLYLVATPIGNSADITLRALALLQRADLVACEDSRVTGPFLKRHGIQASLLPYHEHNAAKVRPQLLQRLAAGAVIALVSDAGTPLINDPGYKLVRECIAAGIPVTALPGASAVLTALSLSGLPSDRFLFAGFPPARAGARASWLAELKSVRASVVLLESPQRLAASLAAMAEAFGGSREAAVARELTKKFEEVRRGSLAELAGHYAEHGPPKGEVTLVIGPPPESDAAASVGDLDAALTAALRQVPLRQAVDEVSAALGLPRKAVYARALQLRDHDADGDAGEG